MAGTPNVHPDTGGRTGGNLSPPPLRGHSPTARSFAPRQPSQSSAASGTARRSRPERLEARPKACLELGPGGLRVSASRESKGRRGRDREPYVRTPRWQAHQTVLPREPCFDTPNADAGTGEGTGDNLPAPLSPLTNSSRSREGGKGWAGLPGELSPPSLQTSRHPNPGLWFRLDNSSGTQPPSSAPPTHNQPTKPPLPAGPPPGVRPAYLVRARGGAPAGPICRARGS